jgi:predicted RNA binding protein YcfA (HicA-like mRNA interferase family)
MPKLAVIKPKQLIRLLSQLGFVERDAQGSHSLFRHPDGRTTTVAVKNKEISRGLLRKILRDIDLSVEEYEALRKKL